MHAGFVWQNGVQVKSYTYEVLNTYKFKFSLGAISTFYGGSLNKFSVDKVNFGTVDFTNYGSTAIVYFKDNAGAENQNETMEMGEPAPASKIGKVILRAEILKTSETAMNEVKSGLQLNLIANTNYALEVNYNNPFDHSGKFNIRHVYLPVAAGMKTENTSGTGAKFKGLGGALGGSSGSKAETQTAVDAIVANHNNYFTWTTQIIGGIEFQKLEIEVYESEQTTTDDAKACKLEEGEEGKTRKLMILIGQKDDLIYCLAIFKSEVEGLTNNEKSFFDHVVQTFKFLKNNQPINFLFR